MKSDEPISTSRRRAFQGASLAAAAAVTAPAFAASQSGITGAHPGAQPISDPTALYPHAPFPAQSQPWPGLASRMNPRPDHGEQSYQGSGKLAGRRALITGGDSGLGRAAAIAYAREGADVAINYLPQEEEDAQEVIALIRQAGRKAVALPGDIRSEGFCNALVTSAAKALDGLDILVNCAGRQHSHDSILDISTEQFDWTLKTNLYALFWLTKAAIPLMPAGSAIVYTTSVNAYNPSVNLLDYSITKAGIANMTKGLAKQVIKHGIRVNAIAPGPFWTALQVSGGQTEKNLVEFGKNTPMGRPGQPAEIAPLYVQLAASDASYITGQVFGASGGNGEP
jgi:NAD(P)-dependent dehydrogenase (short-subunit alcohol dehydrogenase family)